MKIIGNICTKGDVVLRVNRKTVVPNTVFPHLLFLVPHVIEGSTMRRVYNFIALTFVRVSFAALSVARNSSLLT